MRYLIVVAVVSVLVGCETSAVDEPAAVCEAAGWSRSRVLEALVIVGERARDTGATKEEMRDYIDGWCFPLGPTWGISETYDECLLCLDAIVDAVYGD